MLLKYTVLKNDLIYYPTLKSIIKNRLFISSKLLVKLKEHKLIFLNDKPVNINEKINLNDTITINLDYSKILENKTKFQDKFVLKDMPLDILFEDDYILVVNKPPYLPVHPSANNYENTLSNIVANYLNQKGEFYNINIITRLDKNTSGICIFAKNSYIQELFLRKKEIINIQKEYLAILNGIISETHGILHFPITRKPNSIMLREVNFNSGKYAKTEYFNLKVNSIKKYSVVKVLLHTGRTHQIRVHFHYIIHSLLGDTLYQNNIYPDTDTLIKRHALHAYKVSFRHPITEKEIKIIAPIPEDMQNLLNF